MSVSQKIRTALENSSWIRRMFEEGAELKARLGAERVFDFSLGNPNLEPPPRFHEELAAVVAEAAPGKHSYMPNAGLTATREALAAYLRRVHGVDFTANDFIVTCGAAGGLNIILKTILDPGDEVVILAPYFPEYFFYADNHGGAAVVVETDEAFQPDPARLAAALTPRTRAVLLNSPNNPTGVIYGEDVLAAVGRVLAEHSRRLGRPIYLVADEPYSRLVFDGASLPSIFAAHPDTIVATSFSKDLSIPGERLGYVAVSPRAAARQELVAGLILANRILGFVNAPALMQRVVARLTDVAVDLSPYARNRDRLGTILREAGYDFHMPQGAFYFFPKAPGGDDLAFVQQLKEENILGVPGRGFGRPGYFRLAFCVSLDVIEGAAPGFARAFQASR